MTLLQDFRAYLVTEGLVREPRVAGALPPAWLQPREGTPAPGEGQNLTERGTDAVVGIFRSGGLATRRFEEDRQRLIVDVWIRTLQAPVAEALADSIRRVTINQSNWLMNGRRIVESLEWSPLQELLPRSQQVYTFRQSFSFEVYST